MNVDTSMVSAAAWVAGPRSASREFAGCIDIYRALA
jgi:hypothetical protein